MTRQVRADKSCSAKDQRRPVFVSIYHSPLFPFWFSALSREPKCLQFRNHLFRFIVRGLFAQPIHHFPDALIEIDLWLVAKQLARLAHIAETVANVSGAIFPGDLARHINFESA